MTRSFFNREDEGTTAFVSMLISVALTLGVCIALAMIAYLIVFTILFWLLHAVGISEMVAFTIAYAFGSGASYAVLLGFMFSAGDLYLSIYMTLSQSVIPSVVGAVNRGTSWISGIAQSRIAAQRAKMGV